VSYLLFALSCPQYTFYFESPVAPAQPTAVFGGDLEISEALPMAWMTQGADSDVDAESMTHYLLTSNTSTRMLRFESFPNGKSPLHLHWNDDVTVEGVLKPKADNPAQGFDIIDVYALGVKRDTSLVDPQPGNYAPVSAEILKPLYVLMDFSDSENSCDGAAPAGVSGRDFIKSLLYTGTYHGGRSIRGQFAEMSQRRLTLEQEADLERQIAGPYTFSQFSRTDSCDSQYSSWLAAARSKATVRTLIAPVAW